MIDKDSSHIRKITLSFLSFFAQYDLAKNVIDVFYVGITFHPLTNVFDFLYLAATPYDIFGPFVHAFVKQTVGEYLLFY